MHVLDDLAGLGHGANLDPRLDVLLDAEIEHLLDFGSSTNNGSSEGDGLAL